MQASWWAFKSRASKNKFLLMVKVLIQPPTMKHLDTKSCVIVLGLLVVTNGRRANSDKAVTMLLTCWWLSGDSVDTGSGRTLVMRWTPKWLGEKARSKWAVMSKTQFNLCYGKQLVSVPATNSSKMLLNFFLFPACPGFFRLQVFSQDCFEASLKIFKLPNIFLRFVLKRLPIQILSSNFSLNYSLLPLFKIF